VNAGRKSWPVRDLIVWAARVGAHTVVGVPITVFLLDDHEIVRRGIAQLLETEDGIKVIGQAGTAAEALARIPARPRTSPSWTFACRMATACRSVVTCAARSSRRPPA